MFHLRVHGWRGQRAQSIGARNSVLRSIGDSTLASIEAGRFKWRVGILARVSYWIVSTCWDGCNYHINVPTWKARRDPMVYVPALLLLLVEEFCGFPIHFGAGGSW